jgi:hypothetical protein
VCDGDPLCVGTVLLRYCIVQRRTQCYRDRSIYLSSMIISACRRSLYGGLQSSNRHYWSSSPVAVLRQTPRCPFTTTRFRRKAEPPILQNDRQIAQQAAAQKPLTQVATVKPETVEKSKPGVPAGQDPLLAESNVSNKEQRKADWAIIKEMSRYLWPKVDSLRLIASQHKLTFNLRTILERECGLEYQ